MVDNINNASLTALNAYSTLLNNTANNVANINTDNYKPLETTMQDSRPSGVTAITSRNENGDRVDLSQEAVNLITAETGFKANIDVLKTAQKMQKTVIDIIA
jgi:flagellar hook protein FlgE